MEGYLLDWANLLLRWLHVIVAIAWIGSSFYFVWLDNSLKPPQDPKLKADGVSGSATVVRTTTRTREPGCRQASAGRHCSRTRASTAWSSKATRAASWAWSEAVSVVGASR